MAANFIDADKNSEPIRMITRGIQLLREGGFWVGNGLAALNALKDGDGSQASDFAALTAECSIQQGGYASANAASKALYDESNSVAGNAAAGVSAAEQLCGYLGV